MKEVKVSHEVQFHNRLAPGAGCVSKFGIFRILEGYCGTYNSVSQPPGRGPVPELSINYTGPREVLLAFVIFS